MNTSELRGTAQAMVGPFKYGRALQETTLSACGGQAASFAAGGTYEGSMESSAA
jgi:hypothetical protein